MKTEVGKRKQDRDKDHILTYKPPKEVIEAVKETHEYLDLVDLAGEEMAQHIAYELVRVGVTYYGSSVEKAWDAGFAYGVRTAKRVNDLKDRASV